MFKSKYTLWFITFLIGIAIYNIFAIVQIEFNTVSLYSFKKFTIECGTIYDLLTNNVDFSQNKNFLFFNEQSEKWKPENGNTYIYDCKDKNTTIDKLSSDKIIEFLESN